MKTFIAKIPQSQQKRSSFLQKRCRFANIIIRIIGAHLKMENQNAKQLEN